MVDQESADLADARNARLAARRLDTQERYAALLRLARRTRLDVGGDATSVTELLGAAESELQGLRDAAGGRVVPRRRPRSGQIPETSWTVYLDECGAHTLDAKEPFGAFVLAAILVRDDQLEALDCTWKEWKAVNLGASGKNVHEPDVRKGSGPFSCGGTRNAQEALRAELATVLRGLDFTLVACVLDRNRYVKSVGLQPLDDSLPGHAYLMTLHFVMERVAMAIDGHLGGGRARVVAEARGPKEDALLQYEYARLHLDGTAYVSAAWFRHQLTPGITFVTKSDNVTGVQLADLAARPCGEKVLDPSRTPPRWPEFRDKLCQGQETLHSILGLKITPWDDMFTDIWKS